MEQVSVFLPKTKEEELFVGVNGVGYRLRRGVELKVPAPVAEVIRHAEEAEAENEAFVSANA